MKDDFQTLSLYAKGRTNPYGESYESICKRYMGSRQKAELRKIIGFKFERSDLMNLPEWRLKKNRKNDTEKNIRITGRVV